MNMNSQIRKLGAVISLATMLLVAAGCTKHRLTSSASIVIEPGVSFDTIRPGWTAQQVIDSFGEPEERSENELKYADLGISVKLKNNVVQIISCLNAQKDGPIKKSFAGHTKEGIGFGSSRDDIIHAYGEPSTTESSPKAPGVEVLRYKSLGLFFMLRDEKVLNMSVIF